jgi:hypothetical protein
VSRERDQPQRLLPDEKAGIDPEPRNDSTAAAGAPYTQPRSGAVRNRGQCRDNLEFLGPARYDDLLEIASVVQVWGRAKLRFEVQIHHAESRKPVVRGYTVHAFTDRLGKPIRPPKWFVELMEKAAGN